MANARVGSTGSCSTVRPSSLVRFRRRLVPNPLTLLLCSATIMGAVAGIDLVIRSRSDEWRAARSEFSSSIGDSRLRLASVLGDASRDEALTRGMDWGLGNSVTQALASRLRKGEIDELVVVDPACTTLSESRVPGLPVWTCNAEVISKPGRFFWTRHAGNVALGLAQGFDHERGGRLVMVGLVHLNGDWLGLHPRLRGVATILDASMVADPGKQRRGEIGRDGRLADGHAAVALVASDWLVRLLPRSAFLPTGEDGRERTLWASLAVVLVAAAWTWNRERLQRRRLSGQRQAFLGWAGSLVPGGNGGAHRPPAPVGEDSAAFFVEAQALVSRALQARIDANRALVERRTALEQRIDALKKEMVQQDRRIGELAQLDSLSLQMHRLTGAFLARVKAVQGLADESLALMRDGVGSSIDDLGRFVYEWQVGMRERGVRKYLRSLSETPGAAEGQSVLDEHMAFLRSTVSFAGQQTVKASMTARRFSDDLQSTARIARLWRGLALAGTQEDEVETVLGQALTDAKRLFEMDVGTDAHVRVAALPELSGDQAALVLKVPTSPLVAALYHVLLCIHENVDSGDGEAVLGPVSIVGTVKPGEGGERLLVLSLLGASSKLTGFGRGSRLRQWNLQVADHLLTPYGMKIVVLPRIGHAPPVAICWNVASVESVETVESPLMNGLEDSLPFETV